MIPSYTVSIAPMIDVTDRHFRFFMRLVTRHALLYTQMLTTKAVIFGKRDLLLGYSPEELPLGLQLGGEDPKELALAARIGEEMGVSEINMNVGCPSDRVQSGNFGACLMARPERVAEGVAAMKGAVKIPVTVKHRIGIDDLDRYEDMAKFVEIVAQAGCDRFIIHARMAWLNGIGPKENRTIPPLRYDDVYRLKREMPHLNIAINGGIRTTEQMKEQLCHVDGVMLGRVAYEESYALSAIDREFFSDPSPPRSRDEIVELMCAYARKWVEKGGSPRAITRHLLGLYTGVPGARSWRRNLPALDESILSGSPSPCGRESEGGVNE